MKALEETAGDVSGMLERVKAKALAQQPPRVQRHAKKAKRVKRRRIREARRKNRR
jgi:hypothetical protein